MNITAEVAEVAIRTAQGCIKDGDRAGAETALETVTAYVSADTRRRGAFYNRLVFDLQAARAALAELNPAAKTEKGMAYAKRVRAMSIYDVIDAFGFISIQNSNNFGESAEQLAILREELLRRNR